MRVTKIGALSLVLSLPIASGCAYLQDRMQDALDIGTLTVGFGAGVQPRVGPLSFGLIYQQDVGGLRAGEMLAYPNDDEDRVATQVMFGWLGFYGFDLDQVTGDPRGKGYPMFLSATGIPAGPLFGTRDPPAEYYSEIEVAAGVGLAVRVGINPGELLDFVLGWFGVDIYDDDLHATGRDYEDVEGGDEWLILPSNERSDSR